VIDSKWVRGGCVLTAILMAVTLFVGAETAAQVPHFPPPFDKVVHFVFYGIMAVLLAHGVGLRWLIVPLILVPVIGAADEWHQFYVPARDASFFDWMADEIGTVVAVCAYWTWRKRRAEVRGPSAE
jgi:VanZ family protein